MLRDLVIMHNYCKTTKQDCDNCSYPNMCNAIGHNEPADMDLSYFGIEYSQEQENTTVGEILDDMREDCLSDRELISEYEKLAEKVNLILDLLEEDCSNEAFKIMVRGILGG